MEKVAEPTKSKQPTEEIVHHVTWGPVRLNVIGTILCVILLNFAAVWYLADYSSNVGYLLIAAKWELLRTLPNPVDVLVLGDSGGNQGVDPAVIWEYAKLSSVNLCSIGDATVLNDAWMLEDYLRRSGVPQQVLIIHGYDIWSRDIKINVLSKIPGSWWNRRPAVDLTLKDRIRVYLNRYAPLYAETRSLSHLLQNPWQAFKRDLQMEPNGFISGPDADPERVVKDTRAHLEFVRWNTRVMSAINRKALEYIRDLAERQHFDVFIANGPLYQGLYDDSAFQAYYQEVREAIIPVVSSSDRMHFILDPPMAFPIEQMQSADHITAAAALDFTARIIDEIAAIQSPPEPIE